MLKVPLPSWPHCNDHLTLWRRVATCTVRLDGAGGAHSGDDVPDGDNSHVATCAERLGGASGSGQRRSRVNVVGSGDGRCNSCAARSDGGVAGGGSSDDARRGRGGSCCVPEAGCTGCNAAAGASLNEGASTGSGEQGDGDGCSADTDNSSGDKDSATGENSSDNGNAESGQADQIDDDEDMAEFVCDFREYDAHPGGWATGALRHLLQSM